MTLQAVLLEEGLYDTHEGIALRESGIQSRILVIADFLPTKRTQALEAIRRTAHAAGKPAGERAERLAVIEEMFGAAKSVKRTKRKTQ